MPESGSVMPIIMRMLEVLPEPLGAKETEDGAGFDAEGEVCDGDLGVVGFADMLQFYDGIGSRVW